MPDDVMPVAPANAEMARAWNEQGSTWTIHVERHEHAMSGYHECLLEALAVQPGERVLDIGCGPGQTALAAARASGTGAVLAVDVSGPMLSCARERAAAAGLTNVEFVRGDAQVFPFDEGSFDAAMSRFGAMFFADPEAAFANVRRALAPAGRLALVAWQPLAANEWMSEIRQALVLGRDLPAPALGAPGPFGLADTASTRRVLERSGFGDVVIEAVEPPFEIGADVDSAVEFACETGFARGLLNGLEPEDCDRARDDLRSVMRAHDTGSAIVFASAGWLITACAAY